MTALLFFLVTLAGKGSTTWIAQQYRLAHAYRTDGCFLDNLFWSWMTML